MANALSMIDQIVIDNGVHQTVAIKNANMVEEEGNAKIAYSNKVREMYRGF